MDHSLMKNIYFNKILTRIQTSKDKSFYNMRVKILRFINNNSNEIKEEKLRKRIDRVLVIKSYSIDVYKKYVERLYKKI